MIRQRLARGVVRAMRYQLVGEVPKTGILVGAPHTSNWDFVTMLLVMWSGGVQPAVLVKKELFRGPIGPVLRALGGIPLDRSDPSSTVRAQIEKAGSGEPFRLIIAAEGSRSKREYWKSGFHRIARETGMPISLAFFDPPTKTLGFGLTFTPTTDVRADMDLVRAFYADKHGIRPEKATEPRLRDESNDAD